MAAAVNHLEEQGAEPETILKGRIVSWTNFKLPKLKMPG